MRLINNNTTRYAVAFTFVFATLLYTGIVRRTFYLLPIAATKLFTGSIGRLIVLVGIFNAVLYTRYIELPVTLFLDRLSHLMTYSDVTGSLYEVIEGISREAIPQSYEALKITCVNFWHKELFFFIPMFEYWLLGFMFLGILIMSITFDWIRNRLVHV
ncbi:hypothetical protein [Vibrio agarivorans]|uniref:hypothetical protein n=1 Tax=Vibrio agarivorans TaxID=153622 RepID=UPI0025B5A29C|nr:hypothetical protein [Vibrio agarivorans]MDN3661089.1 hypothetical protein [Vibrio agarivorans]